MCRIHIPFLIPVEPLGSDGINPQATGKASRIAKITWLPMQAFVPYKKDNSPMFLSGQITVAHIIPTSLQEDSIPPADQEVQRTLPRKVKSLSLFLAYPAAC